jgi:putative membrane protein
MKKLIFNMLIGGVMMVAASCNGNKIGGNTDSTSISDTIPDATTTANAQDSVRNNPDSAFANKAALGSMMEVQLGKVAQQKASNVKVVQFGTLMVNDHTMASTMLDSIASAKKLALPKDLNEKFQTDFDRFAKMDKTVFDKAYIEYMIKDHKEDIEEFKKEADSGKDAELKAFAAKHVPILQAHLKKAEEAQALLK